MIVNARYSAEYSYQYHNSMPPQQLYAIRLLPTYRIPCNPFVDSLFSMSAEQ